MKPFRYERADDERSAVAVLAGTPGARLLGGGTNLVDLMRLGVETPDVLVDVTRLPANRVDVMPDGGLLIGAGVRNSDLAADHHVRTRYPALAEALLSGASGQLRNLATTAGNLLQRTRCAYFQDVASPCNKREPGTGCPAVDGDHRNLAVLGHSSTCVATHPSDMAVALVIFDAVVRVIGPAGVRAIPLVDFHRLPGTSPQRDTVLRRDELIVAVELPRAISPRTPRTARCASARPSRSPWSRWRPPWTSGTAGSTMCGSRWAASRTSRGARGRPRTSCAAHLQIPQRSTGPRGWSWRRRSRSATTPTRSASRTRRSSAR